MVENWIPIALCFLSGIALVTLEVFLPGFGLPGVAGVGLLLGAVGLTWANLGAVAAMCVLILCLAAAALAVFLAVKSAAKGRLAKSNIILNETESTEKGYRAVSDMEAYLGRESVTTTVLRPAGIADFEGVRLNVVTEGEFVNPQVKVRIEKVEGPRIVVRAI